MRSWQRWTLVTVLVVLAVVCLLIGGIYLRRPAGQLPQFLGKIKHAHYHRTKRELASFVLGALFLVLALIVAFVDRRPRAVAPRDGDAPPVTNG
jgi:preprotein translocase subunit SecG